MGGDSQAVCSSAFVSIGLSKPFQVLRGAGAMGCEGSWARFQRMAVGTPKQVLLPPAKDAGRAADYGPKRGREQISVCASVVSALKSLVFPS